MQQRNFKSDVIIMNKVPTQHTWSSAFPKTCSKYLHKSAIKDYSEFKTKLN